MTGVCAPVDPVNAPGCGTIFKLSPTQKGGWARTVLHKFTGGNDGKFPWAGVVVDRYGNIYGTTQQGGYYGEGVVFRLSPTACGKLKFSVLHAFKGPPQMARTPELANSPLTLQAISTAQHTMAAQTTSALCSNCRRPGLVNGRRPYFTRSPGAATARSQIAD
jgi:uncharacterized repeat protein (TIGR03803 family)